MLPNKRLSRFFYYTTLFLALGGLIVCIFFRHDYNSDPESSFRIHIWSPLTLILWALGFITLVAAVAYEPDFDPNTKKVFTASHTELTVVLSSPEDRVLTVRWADIESVQWSPDKKWMNLELKVDFFEHDLDAPIDVLIINDICLSQNTPGFELLMEFIPEHLKAGSPRVNKKKRKKKKWKKKK